MKKARIPIFISLAAALLLGAYLLINPQSSITSAASAPPAANASAAASAQEKETIAKAYESFTAAQPIYEKILEIAREESESDDESDEFLPEEAEAYMAELRGLADQLVVLRDNLKGLPDSMETSDGKTVLAVREYLTMLLDMTSDISELGQYAIDMYAAMQPLDALNDDTEDFTAFAEQLFVLIDESLSLLNKISPPAYIANSHKDLAKRMKEFQDFSADFWLAAALEDPLRLYSCMYRMNRIIIVLEKSNASLESDIDLQSKQAEQRLSGIIAVLHDELERNFAALGAV